MSLQSTPIVATTMSSTAAAVSPKRNNVNSIVSLQSYHLLFFCYCYSLRGE